jgi:hypothetical protein
MKIFMIIFTMTLLVGCGSTKTNLITMDNNAPDVVKSVNDFPKQSLTASEVSKNGYIRIISRSASGQEPYSALEAARIEAQKNVLATLKGGSIEATELVNTGVLTEDQVKRIISGNVRTFDCGAFYDQMTRTGYACMELPLK